MSDTTTRLPGLSNKTEADLRDLYVKEVGQDVPEDLSTVAKLREAITAHRATTLGAEPEEAPLTALDALPGEEGAVESDPESEVEGTQEEVTVSLDTTSMQEFLDRILGEEFEPFYHAVVAEAEKRGIAPAAQPVAPSKQVPEEDRIIAVKDGEEREFTRTSWDILKADRNGWEEKKDASKPKDLL